jgi:hypothetical protein
MKLQRKLHAGLAGCLLALGGWIGAPLQAQQAAPQPEAAAPGAAAFPKGPLAQDVAGQVRKIVMALVKARLPPAEEGAVEIVRLAPPDEKGDNNGTLTAAVDGQTYSAEVYRPFLVEPLNPNEFDAMKMFYVRTTTSWKLKGGLVIPADIYLSGNYEWVSAYDQNIIAAQAAAIAHSEDFHDKAVSRVDLQRKAKTAEITEKHKADMDALTKQIAQLTQDIAKMEAAREQVLERVGRSVPNQSNQQRQPNPSSNAFAVFPPSPSTQSNQTPRVTSGKDANGNLLWQSNGSGVTFYDNLDQSKQELDEAYAAQKTLQAKTDAEVSAAVGPPGAKKRALDAILQSHRRRILGGETISDDEMRAEYEAALGEPLSAPPASGKPAPAGVKPPIQATPARKRGT